MANVWDQTPKGGSASRGRGVLTVKKLKKMYSKYTIA